MNGRQEGMVGLGCRGEFTAQWTAQLQQACGPGVRIYSEISRIPRIYLKSPNLKTLTHFKKTLFKENIFLKASRLPLRGRNAFSVPFSTLPVHPITFIQVLHYSVLTDDSDSLSFPMFLLWSPNLTVGSWRARSMSSTEFIFSQP